MCVTPPKVPTSPIGAAPSADESIELNEDEVDSGAESGDEEDIDEILQASGEIGSAKKSAKRRIMGSTIGKVGKVAKGGAKVGAKVGIGVAKAGVAVTKKGVGTGKKVVVTTAKTGVKIGKGTVSVGVSAGKKIGKGAVSVGVSAGKKVVGGSKSKNPPAKEPKYLKGNVNTKTTTTNWKRERDLHAAVNKTV